MMKKPALKIGIPLLLVALASVLLPACTGPLHTVPVPYLPPAYYDCTQTDFASLQSIFFFHPGTITDEQLGMMGRVFVIKNVGITPNEIKQATDEYIFIDFIRCGWLNPADRQHLKPGDVVDLVGINQGALLDAPNTLSFTGCVFLPAGVVQLPLGGGAVMTAAPY